MATVLSELYRPERYLAALERLADVPDRGGDGGDLPLPLLVRERRTVARLLAGAVAEGAWQPAPAAVRIARLDKERTLFRFAAADRVVHGAVAGLLVDAMERQLSPALYSYRAGRSAAQALRAFAGYLRRHRRAHPDPRTRGLWLVRADVRAYGDSIPMHAGSPLWPELRALLGGGEAPAWAAVEAVIRPPVAGADGPCQPIIGVPTGSPVATALANLYLAPLDRLLDGGDGGGFYARYGDDLLYAHPELSAVRDALARAERLLAARGLAVHPDKLRLSWFNGAGRRDPRAPELPGTTHVVYLGCRIGFDGTIGLPRDKAVALLHELRRRIARTVRLVGADDQRLRAVAGAVATALDPASPVAAPHAQLLAAIDDRRQLAELDHAIAVSAAAALAGRAGVRAFRTVPWRQLRAAGLPSLVARRNGARR
jgi:hypothetical protein